MREITRAALALTKRGMIVQPAHRAAHASGGRQPIATGWQNAEPMSAPDIAEVWESDDPPNLSVLTGARSGVFVIDVDGAEGEASLAELVQRLGPLPETLTVLTPSGGRHIYLQQPPGVTTPTNKSRLAPKIDLRGDGGQVIGPESRCRIKGERGLTDEIGCYRVARGPLEPAPAPQPWLDAVLATKPSTAVDPGEAVDTSPAYTELPREQQEAARAYVQRAVEATQAELREAAGWKVGESDALGRGWEKLTADAAYKLAQLAKGVWNTLTPDEALRALLDAAPTDSTWTARDVQAKWVSQFARAMPRPIPPTLGQRSEDWLQSMTLEGEGESAAPGSPAWQQYTWDDIGNAERLLAAHGHELRWVPERERWATYADGVWTLDRGAARRKFAELMDRIMDLEGPLYSRAADASGKSPYAKFEQFVRTSRMSARISAAADVASAKRTVIASSRAFDNHPMKLNVANGVIDLRTGALLPHDPGYLFMQQSAVSYDPEATAPRWEAFLAQTMPDEQMREYLQRIVGYSITGLTDEQVFFLHHGKTANGKSVFLDVIEAMMGSYGQTVPNSTLLSKKYEQHPADVARMEGRRCLQLSETAQGARLDEALVKRLTGGDTVTARGMGEEFRDFKIVGKFHLVTNHLPHINADAATQRRIRLIHWSVRIPEEERDPALARRIVRDELPGVLAWAVRGCLAWQRDRLAQPAQAQMDTERYIAEEDMLGRFIEERLVLDPAAMSTNEQVFAAYRAWCELQNVRPMAMMTFGKELNARGITAYVGSGARYRKVRIKAPMIGEVFGESLVEES